MSAPAVLVDPYYGTLLEEPVGYPNALGILMSIGVLLLLGLAAGAMAVGRRLSTAWIAPGLATLLLFVLGLTGSRGAVVALAAGLIALVVLAPQARRSALAAMAGFTVATGFVAWEVASGLRVTGLALAAIGAAALVVGGFAPIMLSARIGQRGVVAGLAAVALLLVVGAMVSPPSLTSSYRTAYWRAAVAESRDHPLLGSGAGSYWLSWQEHRTVDTTVRDAHSLYLETLAELGPIGLMLVLDAVRDPGCRRRTPPISRACRSCDSRLPRLRRARRARLGLGDARRDARSPRLRRRGARPSEQRPSAPFQSHPPT